MTAPDSGRRYGLLAEFPTSHTLIEAVRRVRGAGYKKFDAFTPFPDEEVIEALGSGRTKVPLTILVCGILGGIAGYVLQVWVSVEAYPLNVGGRPLHSWPAFIPPTFECTVLAASIGGLVGMIVMNGLPRPHHPLFEIANLPDGDAASIAAWVLREGGGVLPQIDRVDLYETRGSGAIVSRADSEELIPV